MEGKDTAVHAWIGDIIKGDYKQTENSPSALVLPNGEQLQKTRIYGIVVSSDELVIDDGTGSILVRSFEKQLKREIGAAVLVIGRPRSYNGEAYILGEIVKIIDPKWLEIRKKQIPRAESSTSEKVREIIKKQDQGEGADYEEVLNALGEKGEELIIHLLATGELFETKPGKLKVLE